MDNLTHTAIGLFLARIGPAKWSPRATAVMLVAANLPDADAVSWLGGTLSYLSFHRHLTHAVVLAPVMALAAVLLVRVLGRKPVAWPGAFCAALLAIASHLVLDWTNVYGIRLLLPFSSRWLRADTTSVFDLWIWAVLALGIAGPFLGRLVGSEISSGGRLNRNHGRGFAWFALLTVLFYDCGRAVLHSRVVASLESRMVEGVVPLRAAALPDPVNPFQWRGIVETPGAYVVQDLNLVRDLGSRAQVFHKPEADPAIEAARRSPVFQDFLRFSQYPLWRVTPYPAVENGKLVEVFDMRFGTPLAPGFMSRAVLDSGLQVVEASFQFGTLRGR
ncbi:MAG: metal-dependent hydrolase [Candidatus Solibacter sp.]